MTDYSCGVCGHIAFNEAPEKCPVCGAPKSSFKVTELKTKDEGLEKHVPVISVTGNCALVMIECKDIHVKVGETLHPMVPEHFIQWIDLYLDKMFIFRAHLTPDCQPAVSAHVKVASGKVTAVEFCNVHGHWVNDIDM